MWHAFSSARALAFDGGEQYMIVRAFASQTFGYVFPSSMSRRSTRLFFFDMVTPSL